MNKRIFLKTSLLSTFLATSSLFGCNKNSNIQVLDNNTDKLNIIPKQTDIYQISYPLPFNNNLIDELYELNKTSKKSKIITLYNNIPLPLGKNLTWLQSQHGINNSFKSFNLFKDYALYAKEKGFNVCYLLNSPKPFNNNDFKHFRKEFEEVLNMLIESKITDVKVGNVQTLELLKEYNINFNLSASTCFKFHSLSQFKNLLENYPNIKLIDISIEENHNFHFLTNMRKMFPNVKLEVMCDCFCIKGCPYEIFHLSEYSFCVKNCNKIVDKNPLLFSFKSGKIYPWNLEYYSALGINNFKLIGEGQRARFKDINRIKNYINAIENGMDSYNINNFLEAFFDITNSNLSNSFKLSNTKPYLPDISHFIKHGHLCSTNCNVSCNYCETKAKQLGQFLNEIGVKL
ncbi:MAG: hypothetical protein IJ672_09910 [Methanobrevibacter sp.]|nr:hypothetical protein [Methanobrevibacter sp.]